LTAPPPGPSGPPPLTHRAWRAVADHWVLAVGLLVLAYLFLPIAMVVALSFNEPAGRLSYDLNKFTSDNWTDPCGPAGMCSAVVRSVQIGLLATLVATVLGTLMAFALVRHRFLGRGTTNVLVFLPMATPEVVLGSSLLALFVGARVPLGFWTVVVAHVMFCVSFVVVTVKARLAGLDARLMEAAMDLYANEWQTFRRVTLPLVLPGIVAAALLSFSLSFDDFIITNFNSGTTVTFPMYVWGSAQRGIPAQVNVVGTAMFAVSFLLVAAGQLAGLRTRRRSRAFARRPA
jgi:spermidine/putrescine transport system permease protein